LLKFRTENFIMETLLADNENNEFAEAALALVQINWEIGYWFALFGFLGVIAVQFIKENNQSPAN